MTIELTNPTDTDYAANLRVLEAFLKWERRFVGLILERYPVSAEADEILIIQTGE